MTLFETAQKNKKMHRARMILCSKIQQMIERLEEIELMKLIPRDSTMFSEDIDELITKDEKIIIEALTQISNTLDEDFGISA